MATVLILIFAYLLGAISFSYLITKKIKKVDIRSLGSGNAGATNTLRILGTGPAIAVLLLDVAKGVVVVLIARWLDLDSWVVALAGFLAIIGHNWPIYYGFRGGKGVATTVGVIAILTFPPALYAGILTILIIAITRYVSLGSLFLMLATPIIALIFFDYPNVYYGVEWLIALLALWKHRTNINRLIKGKENKLGSKA